MTADQAVDALFDRRDAELEQALARLLPLELAQAESWAARARAAAGRADTALAYLTGYPAASLGAGEKSSIRRGGCWRCRRRASLPVTACPELDSFMEQRLSGGAGRARGGPRRSARRAAGGGGDRAFHIGIDIG